MGCYLTILWWGQVDSQVGLVLVESSLNYAVSLHYSRRVVFELSDLARGSLPVPAPSMGRARSSNVLARLAKV